MRALALPMILAVCIGLSAPVAAQSDFEKILGGLTQGLLAQEQDRAAYVAAQSANTVAGYRNYLARYPKGAYRTNAEQALARLGSPVEGSAGAASQVEARLGITYVQRVAVQRELTRLGYRTNGADGVWGRNTRNAIANWQSDRAEAETGYVTEAQLRVLLRSGTVVTPPDDTPPTGTLGGAEVEASLGLTRTQRVTIQRQLTSLGHNAGVADGLWGSSTRTAIRAWQKANRKTQSGYVTAAQVRLIAEQAGGAVTPTPTPDAAPAALLEERLLGLNLSERADVQRRLTRLGYNTYGSDGTFGGNTRRAIAAWQADEGATITGYLTADQVRLIRVETGG